ncbi:MAG: alpha/beta hydrolase [Anaerolineae bacterium]
MIKRLLKGALLALGIVAGAAVIVPLLIPIPPLEGTVPPEQLADPDSRFIEVNGIKVHYKQKGAGRPAIILLHGFGASLYSWHAVMEPLSEYGTVIAYDRPAFGLTQRPLPGEWTGESPYSTEAQVKLLTGLMDRLGIDRAILIGNSAGGTVATLTALEHPERVQALVLVDPALRGSGAPAWIQGLMSTPQVDRIGVLIARQLATSGDDIIRTAWHDPSKITAETLAGYHTPLRAENWDRALWEFTKASQPLNLPARLKDIQTRTLIITGDDDRIVPTAQAIQFAPLFPNGQLVVIKDTGHLAHEERPDEFMRVVTRFLAN